MSTDTEEAADRPAVGYTNERAGGLSCLHHRHDVIAAA